MLFDITLHNKNNTIIWKYDTNDNTITNENGVLINLDIEDIKETHIKKFTIQLGFSCNMSCSYCLQSKAKKVNFNQEHCDKILEQLNNTDLTNTKIEFWGGEPLLYIEEIKYIVEHLTIKPHHFVIITNGMLLTLDLVKYFIDNNFNITLSHDAQGQDVRGKEPLEKKESLEAIKYLYHNHKGRFAINSVITKGNINTEERLKYFGKYLEESDITKIPHGGEGPVYNSELELLNTETLCQDVYNDIILGYGSNYSYYLQIMNNFFKSIGKKKLENITTKCGIDNPDKYKVLSLDGKELSCHNYNYKFDIKKLSSSDKCLKCPVVHLCKSSCPAMDKDSEVFKKNCEVMFSSNMGILRVIFFMLTNNEYEVINIKESISTSL